MDPDPDPTMATDSPQSVVERYWDGLWRRCDVAVVDEVIGEPYVRHSSAGIRSVTRTEFKRELKDAWRLFEGATTTIEDQVADGDRVWTRATTQGINPDTGETSVMSWLAIHRVDAGLIVESWSATLPGVDWRR